MIPHIYTSRRPLITGLLVSLYFFTSSGTSWAASGRLRVDSTPRGANIYVDGVKKCVTPCQLTRLPVGKRVISFEKAGFVTMERFAKIVANKTMRLGARLVRRPTHVTLKSIPSGCKVTHKGNILGATPLQVPTTSLRFSLELSKKGYQTLFKTLQLTPSQTGSVTWRLQPIFGHLHVNTEAGPAWVWIAGVRVGVTPLHVKLAGGSYDVQIKRKRFITTYHRVFVAPLKKTVLISPLPPMSCSSLSPNLVDGKKNGPYWRCWANRYWRKYQRWFQGKLHGASIEWYKPGCTTHLEKGRLWDGGCKRVRKSAGTYNQGKRVGTWLFWTRAGVRRTQTYTR